MTPVVVEKPDIRKGVAVDHDQVGHQGAAGDMAALDVSHPCTTLDRWRLICQVPDDYTVTAGIQTCFQEACLFPSGAAELVTVTAPGSG